MLTPSYMSKWIAQADRRETSPEIMEAIGFFANDVQEAERLWNGDGFGEICYLSNIFERVTKNGSITIDCFLWGAAGNDWFHNLSDVCKPMEANMRLRVTLEYDIKLFRGVSVANQYKTFREELRMLTSGEQGLPGKCVYATMEDITNEPKDRII